MAGVFIMGLLLGMQHALDADHLAAVASLAARRHSMRGIVGHGVVWGLGHMLTLTLFAGAFVLSGRAVGARWAERLELAVGLMLVLLGASVLWRLVRERVHVHRHVHRHAHGRVHLHAHSHRGGPRSSGRSVHEHTHSSSFPLRNLLVGMMHGLAGSAALVVLVATALRSPLEGTIYVVLFGLGSLVGMAVLSAAIAVPLSLTAHLLSWANQTLQGAIGATTIVLGSVLIL